jgi:hypothetical protein
MSEPTIIDRVQVATGRDVMRPLRRLSEINQDLHALGLKAAGIKGDLASLRAQFFGFEHSNYNHERKVLLAELMEARRQEMIEAGEKYTEGYLTSYAHAHPVYKSWLATQHERRERMHRVEAELAQVEADIEAAQGERTIALQASRLMEEMIRFARGEMGMD